MLLIPCPWCGPRDEVEFRYGGEAHIARPAVPDALDDAAWAEYLYMRANPKGVIAERWVGAVGVGERRDSPTSPHLSPPPGAEREQLGIADGPRMTKNLARAADRLRPT